MQRACAFNLGAAYVEAGKAQKGLNFLRWAQPSERGERVADLQFNLAVAHESLGEAGRAAGHYLQAAQLYRSQGDGASEGDTCMKMADCHILLQVSQYRVEGALRNLSIVVHVGAGEVKFKSFICCNKKLHLYSASMEQTLHHISHTKYNNRLYKSEGTYSK